MKRNVQYVWKLRRLNALICIDGRGGEEPHGDARNAVLLEVLCLTQNVLAEHAQSRNDVDLLEIDSCETLVNLSVPS